MAESSSSNYQDFSNDEEAGVVTMVDVLNEEQELEEDANAVLGASDDKNCTYSQGYMKRQALYACMTCITTTDDQDFSNCAGICLACSYNCHANHKVVELYTKRMFRCDCGNTKFWDHKCNLDPNKDDFNEKNKYNQNFVGLYCTCKRPYPDEEDEIDDMMIQCIICEDWYHSRHLKVKVPSNENYAEMICMKCMTKHSFLSHYASLSVTEIAKDDSYNTSVDIENGVNQESKISSNSKLDLNTDEECRLSPKENNDSLLEQGANSESRELTLTNNEKEMESNTESKDNLDPHSEDIVNEKDDEVSQDHEKVAAENDKNVSSLEEKDSSEESPVYFDDEDRIDCKMPRDKIHPVGTTFWADNWRKSLCVCTNCIELYHRESLEFLIDINDTVKAYEEQGKEAIAANKSPSQYEAGLEALSSLDRVKQVEAISEYNEMKDHLKEYLQKFVENKKVVREEDIREFFAAMTARKKQKVEIPHFCR